MVINKQQSELQLSPHYPLQDRYSRWERIDSIINCAMLGMIHDQQYWHVVVLLFVFILNANTQDNELKMVHVVFRHGEKAPNTAQARDRYPKHPYLNHTFFPEGPSGLTNDGKRSMYEFGTFLREKYNDFLGDIYYRGVARVRVTESERTMTSVQLVNAGLWPPSETQRWNKDLLWIPIAYEYVPSKRDSLMLPYKCPTYEEEYERVLQSDEVQTLIDPHREFFANLSDHTGANITGPRNVFFLYQALESLVNYNFTLPSWTEVYFPDGKIYDVTLLAYDISAWSDLLKRVYGGPLLRDVLQDYKKLIEAKSASELNTKITLYSGHESNICALLKTLGLWFPHVPDFSSAVIFELYSNNSTNEFGIQILYHLGRSRNTMPLTLPGCTPICPISEFTRLLSNVIPDDVDEICGYNVQAEDE